MFRKTVSVIVPAVAGAASAMAIVLLFARPTPSVAAPNRGAGRAAALADRPSGGSQGAALLAQANSARLHRLERRVDEAPARRPAEEPTPVESLDPAAAAQHEERVRAWKDQLADQAAEPVDRDWSSDVTPRFETDLDTISDGAFETVAVRCATSTCTAEVEFPTFADATQGFRRLLQHPYQVNCATKTVLSPPEDPEAPYRATILYDCGAARAAAR